MGREAQRQFYKHLRSTLHSDERVGRREYPPTREGLGQSWQPWVEYGVGSHSGICMHDSDPGICVHVIMANAKGCCETSGKLLDLSVPLSLHSMLFL